MCNSVHQVWINFLSISETLFLHLKVEMLRLNLWNLGSTIM